MEITDDDDDGGANLVGALYEMMKDRYGNYVI